MRNQYTHICCILGLALLAGCATTKYDEDPTAHMDFVDRATVEKMSDDEIVVKGAQSMAEMKKQRKMMIAVAVDISDQSQGAARPPNPEKLITSAQAFARSYLTNVKGYQLEAVSPHDLNRALKSSDDIGGVNFPFLANLKVILTSEINKARTEDIWEYTCRLQWELVDNRTTINGLGELPAPKVVASMISQNVTTRREKVSVGGVGFAGDALGDAKTLNAQNAYNIVIGNCMSQFYAQLAKRVPFGGVVSSVKELDGNISFIVKADEAGQGVVPKMQMTILNEDGDRLAVGQVVSSANGKSSIKVWRWLSSSYKKQIQSVTSKGKAAAEEWLDENPLDALCLGIPKPDKDMLLDFRTHK